MSEHIPAGGPYRTAIGLHESLSMEHVRAARETLSYYCRAPGFCSEYQRIILETGMLAAKARLEELAYKRYTGMDQGILEAYRRLTEFYGLYLSGLLVPSGEGVLVKARAGFHVPGSAVAAPGDVLALPLGVAASLYAAGLVEPVRSIADKLKTWWRTLGEPGERIE